MNYSDYEITKLGRDIVSYDDYKVMKLEANILDDNIEWMMLTKDKKEMERMYLLAKKRVDFIYSLCKAGMEERNEI